MGHTILSRTWSFPKGGLFHISCTPAIAQFSRREPGHSRKEGCSEQTFLDRSISQGREPGHSRKEGCSFVRGILDLIHEIGREPGHSRKEGCSQPISTLDVARVRREPGHSRKEGCSRPQVTPGFPKPESRTWSFPKGDGNQQERSQNRYH